MAGMGPSLHATCTATKNHAYYSPDAGSGSTATVNATAVSAGDLIVATAWCHTTSGDCSVSTLTVNGTTATRTSVTGILSPGNQDTGIYSGTGHGWLYYYITPVSGSLPVTATFSGTYTDAQVSFVDFSASPGCSFSHVNTWDALATTLNLTTGLDQGNATSTITGPTLTPPAGTLMVDFGDASQHVDGVNSPWSCPIYNDAENTLTGGTGGFPTQTCQFINTTNAIGYILSAPGTAISGNMPLNEVQNWQSLTASFGLSGPNSCPVGANYWNQAGTALTTLTNLGVTSCYYASKSIGSDTLYDGTTEAVSGSHGPWAHVPGMNGCTGNCASHTPAAGEGFIMRGGDTWVAADLPLIYRNTFGNGTTNNPVYIGVDQSWYAGSSWSRPIWTCGGGACGGNDDDYYRNASTSTGLILDNIEITGQKIDNTSKIFQLAGTNTILEDIYAHGWSQGTVTGGGFVFQSSLSANSNVVRYSVCDGTDTTQNMMQCVGGFWHEIAGNRMLYIANGQGGTVDLYHDNWTGPIVLNGGHQNHMQIAGLTNGSVGIIYNNIVAGPEVSGMGGAGHYWWAQGSGNSGTTWWVFNNLEYNIANGNQVNICQLGSNCGTHWVFNNTFECGSVSLGTGACMGNIAQTGTLNLINNHCIPQCSGTQSTITFPTPINDLEQTIAQAAANSSPHFDQYSESQTYPFSPVAGTNSTVNAGANESSLCTTISASNAAAGAACLNSTGYAVSYNSTAHSVSYPATTPTTRSSWDIGAYEYAPSGPRVSPTSLGPWTNTQVISTSLTASGFSGTVTWSLLSGTVPTGIGSGTGACNKTSSYTTGNTCTISGTLTAANSFSFTIRATDGTNTVDTAFSVTVNAAPSISAPATGALTAGQVSLSYSQAFTVSGGTTPVTCAISVTPTSLTWNSATCSLSGTPTTTTGSPWSFTVTPTDSNGVSGPGVSYSLTINPADTSTPAILNATPFGAGLTFPYTATIPASTSGTWQLVVYQSYNSAGATCSGGAAANCRMTGVTMSGATCTELAGAPYVNTAGGNNSWNDWWVCKGGAAGTTSLTVTTGTSQTGDAFVWEVQYANATAGQTAASQATSTTPSAPALTVGAKALLLSALHPGAAEGGSPSGIHSGNVFTSDSISDKMAFAHYTSATSGSFGAQWDQSPTATYASATYALTASVTCSISPVSIGPYTSGQPVSQQFTTAGSGCSGSWALTGNTNTGLTINSSGLVSGTAGTAGIYPVFTVSYGSTLDAMTLTINGASSGPSFSQSGRASRSGGTKP